MTTSAEWAERARQARADKTKFRAAAFAYFDIDPTDGAHTDYLAALYLAELDKADAARRYARWCDDCAGSALADEHQKQEAS